jgi:hypothetical protein
MAAVLACLLVASACGGREEGHSYERLEEALDDFPVPSEWTLLDERQYAFPDGPLDERNAVERRYDPAVDLTAARQAIDAVIEGAGLTIESTSNVSITVESGDVFIVVFLSELPLTIRAY